VRSGEGRRGPVTGLVLGLLGTVLIALLAACGQSSPAEIPPGQSQDSSAAPGPVVEAGTPGSARAKLTLALTDPCYASPDARAVWPRCGRWVEESASVARTATSVLPGNAAIAGAAAAVSGAHDEFVARGCPGTGPTVPLDANSCIGALTSVRSAMGRLAAAVGPAS
jgi:predicted small lipoprotein YifL